VRGTDKGFPQCGKLYSGVPDAAGGPRPSVTTPIFRRAGELRRQWRVTGIPGNPARRLTTDPQGSFEVLKGSISAAATLKRRISPLSPPILPSR